MSETARKLRFAYMDHWRIDAPQGYVSQYSSVKLLDSFVKQIAALGFEGIETFDFHLGVLTDLFGSLANARAFLQERGIDRVVSLFHAVLYRNGVSQAHERATHDGLFNHSHDIVKSAAGLQNVLLPILA